MEPEEVYRVFTSIFTEEVEILCFLTTLASGYQLLESRNKEVQYAVLKETVEAFVDLKSGDFHPEGGVLVQLVQHDHYLRNEKEYRYKTWKVYRVKGLAPKNAETGKADLHQIFVTEISLDRSENKILSDYQKHLKEPLHIHHEKIGTLKKKKNVLAFEGKFLYQEKKVQVILYAEEKENGDLDVSGARKAFDFLLKNLPQKDEEFRIWIFESLHHFHLDDEAYLAEPLDEEYIRLLRLSKIHVLGSGKSYVYYKEGRSFFGKEILLSLDEKSKVISWELYKGK